MKTLLINCCPVARNVEETRGRTPPLHLGYLAAVLEREGMSAAILDMGISDCGLDVVESTVETYKPDLVGMTCITPSFPKAIKVARLVKHWSPTTPVVAGGCHVTFMAENTLRENPEIDIIVRGEGEVTLLELLQCIEAQDTLNKVQGLSFREDGGSPVHTPSRPYISNLDSVPWPARHLVPLSKYGSRGAVLASRGCPNRCIFCSGSAMSGHRYRIRQPSLVVDEVQHLCVQYGIKDFLFLDDTFTTLPERLTIPICQEIVRRGLDISFGCESRVDAITPRLVEHLVQAGARGIQLGVESGSQEILNKIGKRITLQQIHDAVRWCLEGGLRVACTFMLGHPDETEESVRLTRELMKELRAMGVAYTPLSVFTAFPGTDAFERPEHYSLQQKESDWGKFTTFYPVFQTRHFSVEKLRDLYVEFLGDLMSKPEPVGDLA